MAVPAKKLAKEGLPPEIPEIPVDQLKLTAAKLYGQGFTRAQITRALVDHLTRNSNARTEEQRLNRARHKLRKWEMSQDFRDLVYQHAVVALDMSTPGILKGIAGRAKRGRVDAARLVLELTGRHNPKGEAGAPNVVIAINGIDRPRGTDYVSPSEPARFVDHVAELEAGHEDQDNG